MQQTLKHEESIASSWQLLYNVMRELHTGLVRDISRNGEIRKYAQQDHGDNDRLYALALDAYQEQQKMLDIVKDTMAMAQAARQTAIERTDSVAVNALCRELADTTDTQTLFSTDMPDFYEVRTNRAVLSNVISRLLQMADRRTEEQYRGREDDKCLFLVATERGEPGKIVFCVADRATPIATDKAQPAFVLPLEDGAADVARRMELCLLRKQARLLGGDMFIDPEYRDGMRVICYIDVSPRG